jgi:hypothetical protein
VLQPSVLVKNDGGGSTQFDLNATFLYNNMLWLGVSYRTEDAIAPMLGYQFKPNEKSMLKIGYSYDVTTSRLKNYSSGSHESDVELLRAITEEARYCRSIGTSDSSDRPKPNQPNCRKRPRHEVFAYP